MLRALWELFKNLPALLKMIEGILAQIEQAQVEVKVKDVVKDLREIQSQVAKKKLEDITDDEIKALNDNLNGRRG